ncbi:hypothetical protein ACTWQB_16525 [Piscibacillus sp. B03]|uniref:hypothetical protein n=1 Tax=Piscibacillus sp. B03 TaxID=3457430 RepID=UPI003FCCD153
MIQPSFKTNIIALMFGAIVFGTEFFQTFNLLTPLTMIVGGWTGLTLLYGGLFFWDRFTNIISALAVWFIPVSFFVFLFFAFFYGLFMSLPKFAMITYREIKFRQHQSV